MNIKRNTKGLPIKDVVKLWIAPVLLMLLLMAIHFIVQNNILKSVVFFNPPVKAIEQNVFSILIFLSGYWLLWRIINKTTSVLKKRFGSRSLLKIMLPLVSSVFKVLAFLILFNLLLQYLNIPQALSFILSKITSILIIAAISWILGKVVDFSEQLLVQYYIPKKDGTIAARKMLTQTQILKRILYTLIIVLTIGAILMLFDNVRALGASVLTTAGVVGLVFTLAAQKSLGSLLSGLEIAITQPIKIGDTVVINNEMGVIEVINFRSVVVKLWDWRRLVVPTNYFLENIFQNWSREQDNNLIGVVFLFVDFSLPVQKVREELNVILTQSPLWDGRVGTLSVSDLQPLVMQLRVLASAKNAEDVSNLKNEIREKLISYIVSNYPNSLPQGRSMSRMEKEVSADFRN